VTTETVCLLNYISGRGLTIHLAVVRRNFYDLHATTAIETWVLLQYQVVMLNGKCDILNVIQKQERF
jgi:hypothetical protein